MPPARKTILIIEDNQELRQLFGEALTLLGGFDVHEARDGIEALRMIEAQPPDLIILDVGLPTLDGLSVRDVLASRTETSHIPIVIVTGSAVDQDRVTGVRVLSKPVRLSQLVAAVQAALASET